MDKQAFCIPSAWGGGEKIRVQYAGPGSNAGVEPVQRPDPGGVIEPKKQSLSSWVAPMWSAQAPAPRVADDAALHTLRGSTMGTSWSVRLRNTQFVPLQPTQVAIESALNAVVQSMSHWEVDSTLSRFGRARAQSWVGIEPEFLHVMRAALHWAALSQGAFDPTAAALVGLWGFGPRAVERVQVPSNAAIAQALARTGWQRLRLDEAACAMWQAGGVELDLSGIAKGFAVDHVSQTLQALGWRDFLVEVGGELRASGHKAYVKTKGCETPQPQPWQVAIAALPEQVRAPWRLRLADVRGVGMSVAMSGDLWHFHRDPRSGQHWGHTIDPRTGRPADAALASVTVLHARCVDADAAATALTVLGMADAQAFAREHGIAAVLGGRRGGDLSNDFKALNHQSKEGALDLYDAGTHWHITAAMRPYVLGL